VHGLGNEQAERRAHVPKARMRTVLTAREFVTLVIARRWEEVQHLAWPSHTTAHSTLQTPQKGGWRRHDSDHAFVMNECDAHDERNMREAASLDLDRRDDQKCPLCHAHLGRCA